MTTRGLKLTNFINDDLNENIQVSNPDQNKNDLLYQVPNNSFIKHISSLGEKENEDYPSAIANQKIDMMNDCMALNRITIKNIQTLNAVNFNGDDRSFQSLISSTSASTSSIITTSSDETLLPEESKDIIKLNHSLNMKNEKKFLKNENKEDVNDNNLKSNAYCGKELFVVVLNDGNGTAVVQVGDDVREEKADYENPLHEEEQENNFENLINESNNIKLATKNINGLKGLRQNGITEKNNQDKPSGLQSIVTKSKKSFKRSKKSWKPAQMQRKDFQNEESCDCKECDREFDYSSAVNLHIRKQTGERFYKCPRCDFASYYLASIKNHVRSHTGAKPFKCYTCGTKFASSQALLKHKYNCHLLLPKNDTLRCRFCKERFTDKHTWKTHLGSHKIGDFYTCNICHYQKKSPNSLENHMNKHVNNELFICNECGTSFQQKGLLREHWSFYHISLLRKKMYKCSMCSHNFVHFECLCRHTKSTHCKTSPAKKSSKKWII